MRKSLIKPGDVILSEGTLVTMPTKGNGKSYEEWHKVRADFQAAMSQLLGVYSVVMGVGAPARHASYIYGKPRDFLE